METMITFFFRINFLRFSSEKRRNDKNKITIHWYYKHQNRSLLYSHWQVTNPVFKKITLVIQFNVKSNLIHTCPVGWGCRIHQQYLYWGVRPTTNECPGYDTKLSDGVVPMMLELWGMWSTPSLPSLQGPLWPGVFANDRNRSMG